MPAKKRSAPWNRKRPAGPVTHLSADDKKKARARATRSGREYPNLVDNMAIAARKRGTKVAAKPKSKTTGVKRSSAKRATTTAKKTRATSTAKSTKRAKRITKQVASRASRRRSAKS